MPTDFSNIIFLDKTLQTIVSRKYRTTLEVVEAYQQYTRFDDYLRLYKSIDNIMFYTTNDTIIENWRFIKTTKEISESPWYKNAVRRRGIISWNYIYNAVKGKSYLSMYRSIECLKGPLGVLVIGINDYYLNSIS